MRRILRWLVGTTLIVLLIGAAVAWWGYHALIEPQPFYKQAMAADSVQLATHSEQLESRVSALVSEAQRPGTWQSTITADELNGWLATKLPESYPDLLPEHLKEPRVAIAPGAFRVAVQTKFGSIDTVVTIEVNIFATDTSELAVEMLSAHAGSLRLPVSNIVSDVRRATERSSLPVRWTVSNGRPVMLIDAAALGGNGKEVRRLARVELTDGALYLEGTTEQIQPTAQANAN